MHDNHLALGSAIPWGTPHAVSVSLPTLRDVIGYETGDTTILQQLASGYPRFISHRFRNMMEEIMVQKLGLHKELFFSVASVFAAQQLLQLVGDTEAHVVELGRGVGMVFSDKDSCLQAKKVLQSWGVIPSSRYCQQFLFENNVLKEKYSENLILANPEQKIKEELAKAYKVGEEDIFLTVSGTHALACALQCTDSSRTIWEQYGWLYLDSMCLLNIFGGEITSSLHPTREINHEENFQVRALVSEVVTNPLMQCWNLQALQQRAMACNAPLILDTTIATPYLCTPFPFADIAVESLTKYACGTGDVMMGAVIISPKSPFYKQYRQKIAQIIIEPYIEDVQRLAVGIQGYQQRVALASASAKRFIEFLEHHPAIDTIYSSHQKVTRDNYLQGAKSPDAYAPVVSFTTKKPFQEVYDKLRLPKGPSFGMTQTLVMPYVYLAHYDLVATEEGRRTLQQAGISPDIFRVSLGIEPVEEIIKAWEEALGQ